MKNLKTFENWDENRNPAEEGMAAARQDDYLMRNTQDEVSLNLRALDESSLEDILNILKRNTEIIPDEDNEEAIRIIDIFKKSEK